MSSKDIKVLKFNQYQKSDKAPFIIDASLIENSFTTKIVNLFHQAFQYLQYRRLKA